MFLFTQLTYEAELIFDIIQTTSTARKSKAFLWEMQQNAKGESSDKETTKKQCTLQSWY